MIDNIILGSDSYKYSHWMQLPPGTTKLRSYLVPRGGPFARVATYGALQYYARELMRPVEWWMVDEAEEVINKHIGPGTFNRKGWEHIMREHGGVLPLKIRAVPEGYLVPVKNALMTMENTDDQLPWLTNFMETRVYPWYPYTIATLSYEIRKVLMRHLVTSGTPAGVDFMLQDFGFRGTTDAFDTMQAQIGGSANLMNFKGTDTVPALMFLRRYYKCDMAGFSINASEHSTICSWGRKYEVNAYENMLDVYPTGIIACVSDAYNIYEACDVLWGQLLKEKVLARQGVLVIRPDSGNPVEVVLKCLTILGNRFGFTVNEKGFKVLNPKVRLIQGDGVNLQSIDMILSVMEVNGWSADNIVFGMGGMLLQGVTRDTMKWKIAASNIVRNGVEFDFQKDPITDPGKTSLAGNLTLYYTDKGEWVTAPVSETYHGTDMMVTFYENGNIRPFESRDEIWDRLRSQEALPEAA